MGEVPRDAKLIHPARKEVAVKRLLLVVGLTLLVGLSGAAASVLASSPSPSAHPGDESKAQEADGAEGTAEPRHEGVHGGTVTRFQQVDACGLTNTSALEGNWTHGDYVSAVAANGDHVQIQAAAHSRCGKPMVAEKGGPPAHAFANRAAGQAHRTITPKDETTAPSSAS